MIISAPFRENNPRLRAIGRSLPGVVPAAWRAVARADHARSALRQQTGRTIVAPHPQFRGTREIIDRNGVVLANNRPSYDIAMYLDQIGRVSKKTNVVQIAQANLGALNAALGTTITLSSNYVQAHYAERRPLPLPLLRDLQPEMVAAFVEKANTIPGTDLIVMPVRQYPQGTLASHLLGYVNKASDNDDDEIERFYYYQPDSVGRQGVEKACDEYLRGSPGGRTILVNPGGTVAKDLGEKDAEQGGRVTLTIDARLQRIMEDASRA